MGMTKFLSQPIRTKDTAIGTANGLVVGRTAMQGWREKMEDAHLIAMHLEDDPTVSVFGVFDGHGGSFVSHAVSKHILSAIMRTPEYQHRKNHSIFPQAINRGFLETDRILRQKSSSQRNADEVGSTCCLAIITPTHIFVGNIGDSRCTLSTGGRTIALSIDHKPTNLEEEKRIIAAGGSVFRGRVCGGIGVSRSFGDYWFKKNTELTETEQLVSAEPHTQTYKRKDDDEFLVIACDGIWDVLSNDQVHAFIRARLRAGQRNPGTICEQLVDECDARGSRDNMTVILVLFSAGQRMGEKVGCVVQ